MGQFNPDKALAIKIARVNSCSSKTQLGFEWYSSPDAEAYLWIASQ